MSKRQETILERWMRRSLLLITVVATAAILFSSAIFSVSAADRTTVRIFVDGSERALSTDADTVREALRFANIRVEQHDLVEPGLNAKIDGTGFNINIFRARSVLVVDQDKEYKVYTAQQSPKLIAQAAGLKTFEEDNFKIEAVTDFIGDESVGQKVTISRATPLTLLFDGETLNLRTQAKTVGQLLRHEGVVVRHSDQLNFQLAEKISPEMKIIVVRVGHRLVTKEEQINFKTETIYDTSKPVGWSKVEQRGKLGVRIVSYEINENTGKKVALQTVVKTKPIHKIIKRGSKQPQFSGDLSAALSQLRQCESGGNYANKNNSTYRGAYQFSYGTWAAVGGTGDPADAPPAEQDHRARLLQQRSGWGQWPACSTKLGLR